MFGGGKLAACGSRPPGYNSIQEGRRTERPNASGQSKARLFASTMMTETAGEYCLSKFEIQYGFHVSNSSSQHTKRISDKHGRSGNTPEDLSASNLPAFLSVIARLGHPNLP